MYMYNEYNTCSNNPRLRLPHVPVPVPARAEELKGDHLLLLL